jgi:hypothetical protein
MRKSELVDNGPGHELVQQCGHLTSSFAPFGVRRFVTAFVFFELAPSVTRCKSHRMTMQIKISASTDGFTDSTEQYMTTCWILRDGFAFRRCNRL